MQKSSATVRRPSTNRASRPDERQCAMLIVHLLATKQQEMPGERELTRARLSEITVQRLFNRRRISPEFLSEVQEWLFRVGWVLFFAGTTYAVIKIRVIEGWGRISSKNIQSALEKAGKGDFDYDSLEHLLLESDQSDEHED